MQKTAWHISGTFFVKYGDASTKKINLALPCHWPQHHRYHTTTSFGLMVTGDFQLTGNGEFLWIKTHWGLMAHTVYPKKYAHGFVVLCFVVVMQSFIMNSHEVFIHIYQGCFAGTGAIVRLPQCQWSKPDGYGKISQCITTTKHSKAKTVFIFLGIYCICVSNLYTYADTHRLCTSLIIAEMPTSSG